MYNIVGREAGLRCERFFDILPGRSHGIRFRRQIAVHAHPRRHGVPQRGFRRNFLHLQLLQERPYRKYAGRALGRGRYAANGSVHRLLSFRAGFLDEQPEQEQISVLREGVTGRKPRRFDAWSL